MSPLEIVAALLGLANVGLLARRSIWNYPFGIAMVTLYAVIFYRQKLYGEAGLQGFFLVVQIYGWWLWARVGGTEQAVAVTWLGWRARLAWLAGVAVVALSLGSLMHYLTDAAMPFADAAITSGSIAAQFLLSFRRIENWILWIAVDLVAVPLYFGRGLYPTSVLYAVFLVLCIVGLREWIAAWRKEAART